MKDSNGFLKGVSNNKHPFMRREDLPLVFMPNGAIYIINAKSFREEKSFLTSKTLNYVMPEQRSVDVDTFNDLKKIKTKILG